MSLMPTSGLLQRVCETHRAFHTLGNNTTTGRYARYTCNPEVPLVRDANHISSITCETEAELDTVLADAEDVFAGLPHRGFHADPFTAPAVVGRFELDDYKQDRGLLLCLTGALQVTPPAFDLRPLESDEQWTAWRDMKRMDWDETAARHGFPYPPALREQYTTFLQGRLAHVQYWGAHVDGVLRGFFSAWPGTNGVGYLEDLYAHPDFRHRGIGTALVAHALADARARGAGPCVIPVELADTPKHMYAAMGFRPVALTTMYYKEVGPRTHAGD